MDTSLLNGFAFTYFRQGESGTWLVADGMGRARPLPTKEVGLAVRRRALVCWVLALVSAAVVAVIAGNPLAAASVIALTPPTLFLINHLAVRHLPRSDDRFSRREILFQSRALIALTAAATLTLGACTMMIAFTLRESSLLSLGALITLTGGVIATVWWWARRPEAPR